MDASPTNGHDFDIQEQVFEIGQIISVRDREWVIKGIETVDGDILSYSLYPLYGDVTDETIVFGMVEPLTLSKFPPIDFSKGGANIDAVTALERAMEYSIPNGTGPIRCLNAINIMPRLYQYVPLLMALKQRTVRLYIADDVGVGKTIESLLIAAELYFRGEIKSFSVLCPPILTEQWKNAIVKQFHLPCEVVLSGSVHQLEQQCEAGQSIFQRFPITIVSMDHMKTEKNYPHFVQNCPDLIIVDEAHTCTTMTGRFSHSRHRLLKEISELEAPQRHLILLSATPHRVKESAFEASLQLLNPDLKGLGTGLTPDKHLLFTHHFIQRQRSDLVHFLETEHTPFPVCTESDYSYVLHPKSLDFLEDVRLFCEMASQKWGGVEEMGWWALLGLLRAISSSPLAAVASLKTRLEHTPTKAELVSVQSISQTSDNDITSDGHINDQVPMLNIEFTKGLEELYQKALGLEHFDNKIKQGAKKIIKLAKNGRNIIIFCRFVNTVHYIYDYLKKKSALSAVRIVHVTGEDSHLDRLRIVEECEDYEQRILICTDCMSEGIDLQYLFDVVFHYDLSWNPTRHEQRAGRINRFGQINSEVSSFQYSGQNNPIDRMIIRKVIEKNRTILKQQDYFVPLPIDDSGMAKTIVKVFVLENLSQIPLFEEALDHDIDFELMATEKSSFAKRMSFERNPVLYKIYEEFGEFQQQLEFHFGRPDGHAEHFGQILKILGAQVIVDDNDPLLGQVLWNNSAAMDKLALPENSFDYSFHLGKHNGLYLTRNHTSFQNLCQYFIYQSIYQSNNFLSSRFGCFQSPLCPTDTEVYLLIIRVRFRLTTFHNGQVHQHVVEEMLRLGYEADQEGTLLPYERGDLNALLKSSSSKTNLLDTDKIKSVYLHCLKSKQDIEESIHQRESALIKNHFWFKDTTVHGPQLHEVHTYPFDLVGFYYFCSTRN